MSDFTQPSQPVLSYADALIDHDDITFSHDILRARRYAKVLGVALLIFGCAFIVLSCAGMAANGMNALLVIGVLGGIYLAPGAALFLAGPSIVSGRIAAAIVVLLAGIWALAGMGLQIVGDAALIHFGANVEIAGILLVLHAAIACAAILLIYQDLMVLIYRGSRRIVPGVNLLDVLFASKKLALPENNQITARWLGWLQLSVGSVLCVTGTIAFTKSIEWRQPVKVASPVAVAANLPRFSGDVCGPDGLNAGERAAVLAAINERWNLRAPTRDSLDTLFRNLGAKLFTGPRPITRAAAAAMLQTPEERFGTSHRMSTKPPPMIIVTSGTVIRCIELFPANQSMLIVTGNVRGQMRGTDWKDDNGPAIPYERINRELDNLDRNSGGKFTQPQADAIVSEALRPGSKLAIAPSEPWRGGPVDAPRFPASQWLADGTLQFGVGADGMWISPQGTMFDISPDEILRRERLSAEAQRQAKLLHVSPFAALALSLSGVLSGVVGQRTIGRARKEGAGRRIVAVPAYITSTSISIACSLAFLISLLIGEPHFRRATSDFPVLIVITVFMLIAVIGGGIAAPLRLAEGSPSRAKST